MKTRTLLTLLASVSTITIALAQTMPEQPPLNTAIGGSGASNHALMQLGSAAGEIKRLKNTFGPSAGRDRARTFVNQFPIPAADLGGVSDYYLRSSYVTLGPNGFAPLHTHDERPAYLQVVSGTIHQHRSDGTSFQMGKEDFTFSSDGLVHWWHNNSNIEPISLWIVELCTALHGCEEAVAGGATQLESSHANAAATGPKPMMSIDLAGEFPTIDGFADRQFKLRQHIIAAGKSFDLASLGSNPTYVRVFSGELISNVAGEKIAEGSVYLANDGANGSWSNKSGSPVTLYSVEFEASDGST